MPLISFKCKFCGLSQNKMVQSKELKGLVSKQDCPFCGGEKTFIRQIGAAASATKMVIDNGIMAKSVETLTDIIEINEERSKNDPNKGTAI